MLDISPGALTTPMPVDVNMVPLLALKEVARGGELPDGAPGVGRRGRGTGGTADWPADLGAGEAWNISRASFNVYVLICIQLAFCARMIRF